MIFSSILLIFVVVGSMGSVIVPVEPSNGPPYYQVHYLKIGEKPSYYNYNCWGCNSYGDYIKIFKETGLWHWNLGSP